MSRDGKWADTGLVGGNAIQRESEVLWRLLAKHLNKRYKRKGQLPVALVTVFSCFLDDARENMLTAGYSPEAFDAWVDWGERWGSAMREGRPYSEGDEEALNKAFLMYPTKFEDHPDFNPGDKS